MTIDKSKAVHTDFEGETYYFCSEHCLSAFGGDPRGFVHRGAALSPEAVSERPRWRRSAPPASGTEQR